MKNTYLILLLTVVLAGCDNASKNSSTPVVASAFQYGYGGYELRNGSCFSTSANQQVDNSFCSSGSTNNYGNTNGGSYNGGGYNGGGYNGGNGMPINGGLCYGAYIFSQNSYAQYVYCNGANCSGYMLIQITTGAPVFCR